MDPTFLCYMVYYKCSDVELSFASSSVCSAIEKAELEGKEVEFTLEVLQVINNTTENIGESSSKKCDKKGMRKLLKMAKS